MSDVKRTIGPKIVGWARNRGWSKLHFILVFGLIFGLSITLVSRVFFYFFHLGQGFEAAQIFGSIFGLSAAGVYVAALMWERMEELRR